MSDTIDDIRARAAKAAATCPFVSPTTGHRCGRPAGHRGPVHSCEPPPSTAGDVVVLLAEVDQLTDERDRLQLILDCERGVRAPEGWALDFVWRDGVPCDFGWHRGDDYIESAHRYDEFGWRLRGQRFDFALEAMEAADRAAGGGA